MGISYGVGTYGSRGVGSTGAMLNHRLELYSMHTSGSRRRREISRHALRRHANCTPARTPRRSRWSRGVRASPYAATSSRRELLHSPLGLPLRASLKLRVLHDGGQTAKHQPWIAALGSQSPGAGSAPRTRPPATSAANPHTKPTDSNSVMVNSYAMG